VAVDAVFDSVSVATTFKAELEKLGIVFCSFSEAVQKHPGPRAPVPGLGRALLRQLLRVPELGGVQRRLVRLRAEGRALPDGALHLLPDQLGGTGQFERTLLVADEGAYVSYLEGCTAPQRDENQLHAAVVELVALDDAQIKYSTVQNWYPGDKEGKGGIYNFVTKRGACRGKRSKISWTQVETARRSPGSTRAASCRATTRSASSTRWR
jgi:Fe-S cluster assembly protein SufB